MDKIKPFVFWCQKILPLTYDDSLSYYEVLCKVRDKLNETIKQLNNVESDLERLREDITNIVNETIDESLGDYKEQLLVIVNEVIDDLQKEFNELLNEVTATDTELIRRMNELARDTTQALIDIRYDLNTFKDSINNRIERFETYYNHRLDVLYQQLQQLIEQFEDYKDNLHVMFDNMSNELVAYIHEVCVQMDRLYVKNPFTMLTENVQDVINQLARFVQTFGLTAKQYDDLKLTAMQYQIKRVKASDYDTKGVLLFFKELYLRMWSPFDGTYDYYDNIIYKLANLHKNALTAKEYDDLQVVVDVYDALNLTSVDYDWHSKEIIQ